MDCAVILTIAKQELTISIRNRWLTIFAAVFCILVLAISLFGVMVEGYSGIQSFTRTSASLLNLVLIIVPLVALTMGTLSFTGDKGSAELLFAQPVSRGEILLGKAVGLFASVALSTIIGFLLAGTVTVAATGGEGIGRFLMLIALSLALSFVFLALSVLLATLNRRKAKTFGYALFLWFFFVLFYDLAALAGAALMRGQAANTFLFLSLFGNPVDMVRVATLIVLGNIAIFGASGAALLRFLGGGMTSLALLGAALLLWAALPLYLSNHLIRRQDI